MFSFFSISSHSPISIDETPWLLSFFWSSTFDIWKMAFSVLMTVSFPLKSPFVITPISWSYISPTCSFVILLLQPLFNISLVLHFFISVSLSFILGIVVIIWYLGWVVCGDIGWVVRGDIGWVVFGIDIGWVVCGIDIGWVVCGIDIGWVVFGIDKGIVVLIIGIVDSENFVKSSIVIL